VVMIVITFVYRTATITSTKMGGVVAVIAIAIIAGSRRGCGHALAKVPENTLKLGGGLFWDSPELDCGRADYFRHRLFTAEIRGMGCAAVIDFVDNHGCGAKHAITGKVYQNDL